MPKWREIDGSQRNAGIYLEKSEVLKYFTTSLVRNLSEGPSLTVFIDKFRNYCTDPDANCYCSSDLPKGQEILSLKSECHVRRIYVLLRVLLIVQQLLQENKHGSKRDIYYMHPSVFSDQSVVDQAINDICILLQCSRHNLNVVSVGNGLVMGWLRFLEAGRKFDCMNCPSNVHLIPVHVDEVKDIVSVAKYILVVEKESVFQRLANDRFCNANRCIVITQMAYDAKFLRVPEIRWLGAFPSDFEKYGLPQQCLLPLTPEDKRRTETMLLRCYLQREVPQWRLELESMLLRGVKFEIEALTAHSLSFLSEQYIPSKILDRKRRKFPTCLLNFSSLIYISPNSRPMSCEMFAPKTSSMSRFSGFSPAGSFQSK
ncbi:meiotic recombination protein SPO11-1 isoform X10 [Manihot esculenta]|uniref:meiotic recombination protein SPO11-1 isoform X10 n=1 Tax=Manihot esculenta TaxID=3983 RepID=UPI000B5D0A33|nr:meiotic recombination protein SPO11-1 isoform X10 [Manihot esculenta]